MFKYYKHNLPFLPIGSYHRIKKIDCTAQNKENFTYRFHYFRLAEMCNKVYIYLSDSIKVSDRKFNSIILNYYQTCSRVYLWFKNFHDNFVAITLGKNI